MPLAPAASAAASAPVLALSLSLLAPLAFDSAAGAAVDHVAALIGHRDQSQHRPGDHGDGHGRIDGLDGLYDPWLTRFTQARLRGAGTSGDPNPNEKTNPNGDELAGFYDVDAVLSWYDHGGDGANRSFRGVGEIGQSYVELFSRLAAGPDPRMRNLQHSVDTFAPDDGGGTGIAATIRLMWTPIGSSGVDFIVEDLALTKAMTITTHEITIPPTHTDPVTTFPVLPPDKTMSTHWSTLALADNQTTDSVACSGLQVPNEESHTFCSSGPGWCETFLQSHDHHFTCEWACAQGGLVCLDGWLENNGCGHRTNIGCKHSNDDSVCRCSGAMAVDTAGAGPAVTARTSHAWLAPTTPPPFAAHLVAPQPKRFRRAGTKAGADMDGGAVSTVAPWTAGVSHAWMSYYRTSHAWLAGAACLVMAGLVAGRATATSQRSTRARPMPAPSDVRSGPDATATSRRSKRARPTPAPSDVRSSPDANVASSSSSGDAGRAPSQKHWRPSPADSKPRPKSDKSRGKAKLEVGGGTSAAKHAHELMAHEEWLKATRAASRAAFQRLVYESEESKELGAAILERICQGAPADNKTADHRCFLVQRAALESRTKFQVQAGSVRLMAAKAIWISYYGISAESIATGHTNQVQQRCRYPDGTWWCLEPSHLERCGKMHVSPGIARYKIPGKPNALLPLLRQKSRAEQAAEKANAKKKKKKRPRIKATRDAKTQQRSKAAATTAAVAAAAAAAGQAEVGVLMPTPEIDIEALRLPGDGSQDGVEDEDVAAMHLSDDDFSNSNCSNDSDGEVVSASEFMLGGDIIAAVAASVVAGVALATTGSLVLDSASTSFAHSGGSGGRGGLEAAAAAAATVAVQEEAEVEPAVLDSELGPDALAPVATTDLGRPVQEPEPVDDDHCGDMSFHADGSLVFRSDVDFSELFKQMDPVFGAPGP